MSEPARRDLPGAIGSALSLAIGAASFWAAGDYSRLGAVFPRSVGLLLMTLGAIYLVLAVLGRTHRAASAEGSMPRRALVAAVMLGWGFALGPLGFLPSSAAAMAALVAIAQHDRWTARTAVLYGGATGLVLLALYALFKHALLVPLP
jgi:putative tricarboxylic transport membrane protein